MGVSEAKKYGYFALFIRCWTVRLAYFSKYAHAIFQLLYMVLF